MPTSHRIIYIGKVTRDLLLGSDILDPIAGPMAYVLGVFISLLMWSFGLIWLVFALATVLYSSPFPFNMGWWGFTFPLGVYAANTMELGVELDLMFFKVFGTVSLASPRPISQFSVTDVVVGTGTKYSCFASLGSGCFTNSDGGLAWKSVLCPLSSKPDSQGR
jgi:Tellurite resistance protein and related permeases